MVKLFGTTIAETKSVFQPVHFGENQNVTTNDDKIKVIGRIIVSILLVGIAVFCLTSDNKQLGGTIIGSVIGYWLK